MLPVAVELREVGAFLYQCIVSPVSLSCGHTQPAGHVISSLPGNNAPSHFIRRDGYALLCAARCQASLNYSETRTVSRATQRRGNPAIPSPHPQNKPIQPRGEERLIRRIIGRVLPVQLRGG